MSCYHLLIKGKVQGVFFRQSSKAIAKKNNVLGWIRNTAEGHVEAKIRGEEEDLQKFILWCRRGPEDAIVLEVRISPAEEEPFNEFLVRIG